MTHYMWFQFHQNNSGGYFDTPAENIWIEAKDREQARHRFEEMVERLGLYAQSECDCCGPRWNNYPYGGVSAEPMTVEPSWFNDGAPVAVKLRLGSEVLEEIPVMEVQK